MQLYFENFGVEGTPEELAIFAKNYEADEIRLGEDECYEECVDSTHLNTERKITIVLDHGTDISSIASMFVHNLDNVETRNLTRDRAEFITNDFKFCILKNTGQSLRGHRCQVLLNLTDDSAVEQIISVVPVRK